MSTTPLGGEWYQASRRRALRLYGEKEVLHNDDKVWLADKLKPSPQRGDLRHNFGDTRSPWRRDRDRFYYERAFHRLADVTQILHATPKMGRLHNRLTHSLKVSQVARSIAERFEDSLFANPDVCDAAGLAHDLGHPPYGHVGEEVLNDLLRERGVGGYEGNAQTFRVLTKLATHHAIEPGMQLTRATLAACLKYPTIREDHAELVGIQRGVYPTEQSDFAFARQGLEAGRPSVEASIVDWADDISYALHDLEDFYRAGIVSLADFPGRDPAEMLATVDARGVAPSRPPLESVSWSEAFEFLCRTLRSPENEPLNRAFEEERLQAGLLSALTSRLISRWVDGIERVGGGLHIESSAWHEISLLKEYVYERVVASRPETARSQQRERRRLRRLFDAFETWVDTDDWPRLPGGLRFMLTVGITDAESGAGGSELGAIQTRAVADYVSQLTESEARGLEEEMV